MNLFLRQIIPALLLPSAAIGSPVLRFSNDDVIAGRPLSITLDRLRWESPVFEQPAEFLVEKITDLSLPASAPEKAPDHEAVVSLTNGDTIRGQLASINDRWVTLDTWYAGRLNLNRLMVSDVEIVESSPSLYIGPTSLDGWIQSSVPAWTYSQSSFRSSLPGGIARDGIMVEECSITADVAWKGDSIRLRIALFSDDPSNDNPRNGYELSFQRGRVHLRNLKTQNFLGSAQSQALMENDHARFEIRASAKHNRIALFIDDEVVEVWNDPDAGDWKPGSALHFISGSSMPMKISNIRVKEWDGIVDHMPEPGPAFRRFGFFGGPEEAQPKVKPDEPEPGRMQLANGDSLAGEVTSIEDGRITVKTPLGEVTLPVSRFRKVSLESVDAERCKRYKGDVRAWFPDGSSIVFRLDSGDERTLNGFSQNFGHAAFQAAAFNRIEFNIHSPAYQQGRGAENW